MALPKVITKSIYNSFHLFNQDPMYTSILFSKLYIFAGHDTDPNSLSKIVDVYENDLYVFNEHDNFISSVEIKNTIKDKAYEVKGSNGKLFQHFIWNLN